MSTTDTPEPEAVDLEDLPEFELSYLVDDRHAPTEVTVFPAEGAVGLSTEWITVDADHAIALEDVR